MSPAIIARVRELGYRVFMRQPSDSWLYYTTADGSKIGQLSAEGFGGYKVLSVHVPNRATGSGALMAERSDIDAAALEQGFGEPGWFTSTDRENTKKWRDWSHFVGRDSWNGSYREVLP